MGMSAQQRHLLHLLRQGYGLRIVRSTITLVPSYCALISPGGQSSTAEIPWWRIERLLDTRCVRLNDMSLSAATEIVLQDHVVTGRARASHGKCALPMLELNGRFDFRPLEDCWMSPKEIPVRGEKGVERRE